MFFSFVYTFPPGSGSYIKLFPFEYLPKVNSEASIEELITKGKTIYIAGFNIDNFRYFVGCRIWGILNDHY